MNYNSLGQISLQLPQGPSADSFKIYLFVNVIDDTYGVTVYNITSPVTVTPNDALADSLAVSISSGDASSQALVALNSGNLNLVAKNVIALSTAFNIQSTATSSNQTMNQTQLDKANNQLAQLRDFMVSKVSELSVSDVSSIKVISSALSASTQTPEQVSTKAAVIIKPKL